jgi:HD superfamily phosphohydrolase
MPDKHAIIDPIHGKMVMPQWLFRIKDEASIRRMMGIKQLGLKAFIDFPGAIHTRYLHSLGTMFLAGKLLDLLVQKEESRSPRRTGLVENLKNNRNTLMAAGFFHDIGHGPFSHVMDFVLKKEFERDHEWITTKAVDSFEEQLEGDSIPPAQVNNIITRKHQYPFLWGIINGPLDVDKVDYVLRDSYHVGLRYSFDLDHFFDQIAVLGDEDGLQNCEIGLEKSPQALACSELFLLLWKNMYTLVYLVESSRIAEKMLEKAILVAIHDGSNIAEEISDVSKYMELDESKLIDSLRQCGGFPKETCDRILKKADLYIPILDNDLNEFKFEPRSKFLKDLLKSEDAVSERISLSLSQLGSKQYSFICDIVRSKTPKEIHIDEKDADGEPIEIEQKSEVIRAIRQPRITLKIYANPETKKKSKLTEEKKIKREVQTIIDGW